MWRTNVFIEIIFHPFEAGHCASYRIVHIWKKVWGLYYMTRGTDILMSSTRSSVRPSVRANQVVIIIEAPASQSLCSFNFIRTQYCVHVYIFSSLDEINFISRVSPLSPPPPPPSPQSIVCEVRVLWRRHGDQSFQNNKLFCPWLHSKSLPGNLVTCSQWILHKGHARVRWRGFPCLASTRHWPNVDTIMGQRRRRWPILEPTLGQCRWEAVVSPLHQLMLVVNAAASHAGAPGGVRLTLPVFRSQRNKMFLSRSLVSRFDIAGSLRPTTYAEISNPGYVCGNAMKIQINGVLGDLCAHIG